MRTVGEARHETSTKVFITGALGFLGKFFVRELLEEHPELHLYLLVRGNDKASPEDRVRMAGLLHST